MMTNALHRTGAVQARLHPRPGARFARPEDEQVRRQRARPGRPDRRHRTARRCWTSARTGLRQPGDRARGAQEHAEGIPGRHPGLRRRCAALHVRVARLAGPQHQLRFQALRGLPQLLQQALERDALRADELRRPGLRPARAHEGRMRRRRPCARLPQVQPGRPLDHLAAAARRGRGGQGLRRLPARQRRQRDLPVRLGRVLRLVPRDRQGADPARATTRSSAPRAAR